MYYNYHTFTTQCLLKQKDSSHLLCCLISAVTRSDCEPRSLEYRTRSFSWPFNFSAIGSALCKHSSKSWTTQNRHHPGQSVCMCVCVSVCVKERPAPNWFGWHLSKTKPTFLFTPWLRPSRSHILSVTHTRSHTRVGTHTYSAACTIACLFFRECVRKELWIAFSRSPQRASYSGLTKSYNPVPWNMYKLSHWLLPACSLSDVLPINNPPSSPLSWTRRSLLLLSSYRSTTFSSLLSPVSLSLLPFLTHNPSSTFFLPLTLSRSLPVEFSCQPLTDAGLVQTRANDHITKTRRYRGNRLEEEREKRNRGETPPLFFHSPKLRKTVESHGWRRLGQYRLTVMV